MHNNIIPLLEEALVKQGYRRKNIYISLSKSGLIATVQTPNSRFDVLISERTEKDILRCQGFALSEDSINTIQHLNIRLVLFHCGYSGFLTEARKGPHSMVYEYHDEFGSRLWTYHPLEDRVKL